MKNIYKKKIECSLLKILLGPLRVKELSKLIADDILFFFFHYFLEKVRLDISYNVKSYLH